MAFTNLKYDKCIPNSNPSCISNKCKDEWSLLHHTMDINRYENNTECNLPKANMNYYIQDIGKRLDVENMLFGKVNSCGEQSANTSYVSSNPILCERDIVCQGLPPGTVCINNTGCK